MMKKFSGRSMQGFNLFQDNLKIGKDTQKTRGG